jgi:hypothetical protein
MNYFKKLIAIFAVLFLISSLANIQMSNWKSLDFATRQWITAFSDFFHPPEIITDVKAFMNDYTSWPKSRKHKGFDGGWVMPFEFFEALMDSNGGVSPSPVHIDMNGDGRMDIIYSKGDNGNLIQYMLFARGNGFVSAYKCRSVSESEGAGYYGYWYYGDCADTSFGLNDNDQKIYLSSAYVAEHPNVNGFYIQYTGQAPSFSFPWNPVMFFLQQAGLGWEGRSVQKTPGINFNSITGGTPMPKRALVQLGNGGTVGRYYNGSDPKHLPLVMDINGDALPDFYFSSSYKGNYYYNSNDSLGLSYILMNTGTGFVPAQACVQASTVGYSFEWEALLGLNGGQTYCY